MLCKHTFNMNYDRFEDRKLLLKTQLYCRLGYPLPIDLQQELTTRGFIVEKLINKFSA